MMIEEKIGLRQAAQQALEFCEFLWREVLLNDWAEGQREALEKALMQALAEPEQQPVGTARELLTNAALEQLDIRPSTKVYLGAPTPQPEQHDTDCHAQGICQRSGYNIAPTRRKPLTDEQIAAIASTPCAVVGSYVHTFARAIERAHGITGDSNE